MDRTPDKRSAGEEEWVEITKPLEMGWDPDEISQVAKVEELAGNPLAPLVRGFNELGRRATELDQAAANWSDSMGKLISLISEMACR